MTLSVKAAPIFPGQQTLEQLKGPSTGDIQAEKSRLRRATREFEAFFTYQLLKTMRKTIPENSLTKDTPMADGLGRETFTDLFDLEIARKTATGGRSSIGELLYNSLVKIIDAQFGKAPSETPLKPLKPPEVKPVELKATDHIRLPKRGDQFTPVSRRKEALPLPSSRRPVNEDRILSKYGWYISEAARETKLDTALITSVIKAESGGDPKAVSTAGAKGLMQLTDTTAQALSVTDVFDPRQNIKAGSRYLRQLWDRFGQLKLALAAYNAGPGNVVKYGGVPPFSETENYLERVARLLKDAGGRNLLSR